MEDTVLAALGGSTVTALTFLAGGYFDRRAARRQEIVNAMAALGAALDRVHRELRPVTALDRVKGNLTGRSEGAIEDLLTAMNRALLTAPQSMLNTILEVNVLLAAAEKNEPDWEDRWTTLRGELMRLARIEAGSG